MSAPYNISLNPETGFYNFRTDQGLIYGCKFSRINSLLSPIISVYDVDVHEFLFYPYDPNPLLRKAQDERVSATLQNLVMGYFTTPERVLVYLCDFSDGRARQRSRLFARWGDNMGDVLDHYEIEITIPPETAFVGLMARKDFTYPDMLQDELISKASLIVLEKFG
jgi:hypothetical protein